MTLRTKALLPAAVLSLLLTGYLYGYWMPHALVAEEAAYRDALGRHLDSVAQGLVPLLLAHQLATVYEDLTALLQRNKDWVSIRLLDADGRTLYPLDAAPPPPERGDDLHIITRPITYLDMHLGTLRLTADFFPVLSGIRERNRHLASALVLMLLGYVIAAGLFVDRLVRRPMNQLARASAKLAQGVFDAPLPRATRDEVGLLVDSFGAMRDDIATFQLELVQRNRAITQLSQAVEQSPVSIVITDTEGAIVFVNPQFTRTTGYLPEEAIGRTLDQFRPDLTPQQEHARLREMLQAGKVWSGEFCNRKKSGESFWESASISPIRDERGAITNYLAVKEDITERKEAERKLRESEESLRKREALLRESQRVGQIGSWDWDAVNDVIWWSDEYYRLYGIDPATPTPTYQEHIAVYTPESGRRLSDAVQRSLETGDAYTLDLELASPTVSTQWIMARGEVKRDATGKICGLRGTAQNITERKQAEEAIRKLNEGLERRVAERTADLQHRTIELKNSQTALMEIVAHLNAKTAELEAANEKLQELDRLKSLFIASMSHELRTPLNSIIGFTSILLNEWTGPVNDEQKENLATVLRSGKHLLTLINDVIDVSKVEAGMAESVRESFDLADVVAEAAGTVAPDIRDKGLSLAIEATPHPMHTDRRRLLQCLLNLISNAAKFTERGSVRIVAGPSPDRPGTVAIVVVDTGIGIRDEDLPKLFAPFVRLDAPMRTKAPGTGLGLYLTKKLTTDLLGGTITVSSREGEGSRFLLTLPDSLA